MQSEELITTLIAQTKQIISQAENLISYDLKDLKWRKDPESWSILECLEHLNLYGNFYIPEIESKIQNSKAKNETLFKSGFLGNYFAKSMLPQEKLNKMKTFKNKNPLNTKMDKKVIETFINQQIKLIYLLKESRKISLNKTKIGISITSLVRLKLGDTFQFYINHIERHLVQIKKIQDSLKIS